MKGLTDIIGIDTGQLLEITFALVLLYLVLSRAEEFGSAINSLSRAYTGTVRVLQGR
jgi:hypothetical protein